jgi:hypothetical protein
VTASHLLAVCLRAHVFEFTAHRATHVLDAALVVASPPTLGYTLAGFPSGNLRADRGAPCG